jgi:hypothetical protein
MPTAVAFRADGWPRECCQIARRDVICSHTAVWRVEERWDGVRSTNFFCLDHLEERHLVARPMLEHARRRLVRARFLERHQAAGWIR